eukprot:TRINITY_DN10681_c0_g1_i1.p1 TRINITY_DN10681_c0_g1~~TRINITY_DN10681_c0_g1_i1.p1  ORF type:complete len:1130 (-),score=293.89 TRINITY_DN10681_c0_g1_i1:19-3045(-)
MHWGLSRFEAQAVFRGLDEDADGKLTLQELLKAFRKQHYFHSVEVSAPAPPPPPVHHPAGCADTKKGDRCYKEVEWAMTEGIKQHPEWYPGLSAASSVADFQAVVHATAQHKCPAPCTTKVKSAHLSTFHREEHYHTGSELHYHAKAAGRLHAGGEGQYHTDSEARYHAKGGGRYDAGGEVRYGADSEVQYHAKGGGRYDAGSEERYGAGSEEQYGSGSEKPYDTGVYDCSDGLKNWRFEWSDEKKRICSLISANELRSHIAPGYSGKEVAQILETPGRGGVTRTEWLAGATARHTRAFTAPLTEPQAEFAFRSMDTNEDGLISDSEFMTSLGGGAPPHVHHHTEHWQQHRWHDVSESESKPPWHQEAPPSPPPQWHQEAPPTPHWHQEVPVEAVPTPHVRAKELVASLRAKWETLSNAYDKMDVYNQHYLSRENLRAGLLQLNPAIDDPAEQVRIFEGLDTIADGKITPPEFHGTLRLGHFFQTKEAVQSALGWHPPQQAQRSSPSPRQIVPPPPPPVSAPPASAPWDSAEMQRMTLVQLANRMVERFGSMQLAFHSMDKDHDGSISQVEFVAGAASLQPPLSEGDATWSFQGLDANRDGVVDEHDFLAIASASEVSEAAGGKAPTPGKQVKAAGGTPPAPGMQVQAAAAPGMQVQAAAAPGMQVQAAVAPAPGMQVQAAAARPPAGTAIADETSFRAKAISVAGTMKQACEKMGLHKDNALQPQTFRAAITEFEPLISEAALLTIFNQMDSNADGQLSPEECYLSMQSFKQKLSKLKSIRNTFCDADANNDQKLSKQEFANFVQKLDPQADQAEYLNFFHDVLDKDKDGFVKLSDINLGAPAAHENVLSDSDMEKYAKVPAILQGEASIEIQDQEQLGNAVNAQVKAAFEKVLTSHLGTKVTVAGVQALPATGMKILIVLWTARPPAGGDTIKKLRTDASQLQTAMQAAIGAAVAPAAKTTVWCKSTFDFYGPKAGSLPQGQKITQLWGTKLGEPTDNGSPPRVDK